MLSTLEPTATGPITAARQKMRTIPNPSTPMRPRLRVPALTHRPHAPRPYRLAEVLASATPLSTDQPPVEQWADKVHEQVAAYKCYGYDQYLSLELAKLPICYRLEQAVAHAGQAKDLLYDDHATDEQPVEEADQGQDQEAAAFNVYTPYNRTGRSPDARAVTIYG